MFNSERTKVHFLLIYRVMTSNPVSLQKGSWDFGGSNSHNLQLKLFTVEII